MKSIKLGIKGKMPAPTAEAPDHMVEVEQHPQFSFVAPHPLNAPNKPFKFSGHGRIVAHDARDAGDVPEGHARYTMEVHGLDLPHDGQDQTPNLDGVKEAVGKVTDRLYGKKE